MNSGDFFSKEDNSGQQQKSNFNHNCLVTENRQYRPFGGENLMDDNPPVLDLKLGPMRWKPRVGLDLDSPSW